MVLRGMMDQWLHQIGSAHGVSLMLDEAGAVGLALENGVTLTVEMEEDAGVVHVHTGLMELRPDTRAALIEEALALDLYARATEGATIGLDRRADMLVLSVTRDAAGLDAGSFAALLAGFAETVDRLRDRLQRLGGPATGPVLTGSANGFIDPGMRA